mmetsp:Transcript_1675/g.4165  ORF Transcript_1675/g.4165 Transcript_1675/m.4165 type:complete len:269 (+) Transcript_1675:436-1242(+)
MPLFPALLGVGRVFPDPHILGSHLHHLIFVDVLQGIIQAQIAGLIQASLLVTACCSHVGQGLGLAYIDLHVSCFDMLTHTLSLINLVPWSDEHGALVLRALKSIGSDLSGLMSYDRALLTHQDGASLRSVFQEQRVELAQATGRGEQVVAQTNEAAGGDAELEGGRATLAGGAHVQHFALALSKQLHHGANVLLRHLHVCLFKGLILLAIRAVLQDDLGGANLKLKALTTHVLDKDAQVHHAAPADHKAICALPSLHSQCQVALQLLV